MRLIFHREKLRLDPVARKFTALLNAPVRRIRVITHLFGRLTGNRLHDSLLYRARVIDAEVEKMTKLSRDSKRPFQLVILGAGFDTRAWLPSVVKSNVRVFEIDHRMSQHTKREIVRQSGLDTSHVSFVTVDFRENRLVESLRNSPRFDTSASTLFIWEGVTPYLTEQEIVTTLNAIASIGLRQNCRVCLTYRTVDKNATNGLSASLTSLIVRLRGEQFKFFFKAGKEEEWIGTHVGSLFDIERKSYYAPGTTGILTLSGK